MDDASCYDYEKTEEEKKVDRATIAKAKYDRGVALARKMDEMHITNEMVGKWIGWKPKQVSRLLVGKAHLEIEEADILKEKMNLPNNFLYLSTYYGGKGVQQEQGGKKSKPRPPSDEQEFVMRNAMTQEQKNIIADCMFILNDISEMLKSKRINIGLLTKFVKVWKGLTEE